MAKRRGNREGTIYQRRGSGWRAQASISGRRVSFSANTRRECVDWLKAIHFPERAKNRLEARKISLSSFLKMWLTSSKASLRQSTWTQYAGVTRNHINPAIGNLPLSELNPIHIQALYDNLLADGAGPYTVIKVHTLLHSSLKYATRNGFISENPAKAAIPPKPPSSEITIFNEVQVNQFLNVARGHRQEALFFVALTTGMRQTELLGLMWSDLDWRKQTISVERQLVRPRGSEAGFIPPKTRSGKRLIALGSRTTAVLKMHLERQLLEKDRRGSDWEENDLIFPSARGTPLRPRNLLRSFKALLRRTNLPAIRFHDLRHTSASLMLNSGVPLIVVSRRLGHARPSITLDIYGHRIPGVQAQAAELIDEVITPIQLHQTAPETAANFETQSLTP